MQHNLQTFSNPINGIFIWSFFVLTENFQYKLKESPIPSDEEESSEESSDDEFGPKKPKVDPDDPVARELLLLLLLLLMMMILLMRRSRTDQRSQSRILMIQLHKSQIRSEVKK